MGTMHKFIRIHRQRKRHTSRKVTIVTFGILCMHNTQHNNTTAQGRVPVATIRAGSRLPLLVLEGPVTAATLHLGARHHPERGCDEVLFKGGTAYAYYACIVCQMSRSWLFYSYVSLSVCVCVCICAIWQWCQATKD